MAIILDNIPVHAPSRKRIEKYPFATMEVGQYVLRDHMTDDDVTFNVTRLRSEARAKLAHADALEAWGRSRNVA
jgi:hypothetical protein